MFNYGTAILHKPHTAVDSYKLERILARSQTFTAFDTCNTKFTHRMSDCKHTQFCTASTQLNDVLQVTNVQRPRNKARRCPHSLILPDLSLSTQRRPHSLEPLSTPVLSLAV